MTLRYAFMSFSLSYRPNDTRSFSSHRLGQYIQQLSLFHDTEFFLSSSRLTGYGPFSCLDDNLSRIILNDSAYRFFFL